MLIQNKSLVGQNFVGHQFGMSLEFERCEFDGCTFAELFPTKGATALEFRQCKVSNCTFDSLDVDCFLFGSGNVPSLYDNCHFSKCVICAPGSTATFKKCAFEHSVFRELFGFNMEFLDCSFSCDFRGAVFAGRPLQEGGARLGRDVNRFDNNDFRQATLFDVDFRGGIDLYRQKFLFSHDLIHVTDLTAAIAALTETSNSVEDSRLARCLKGIAFSLNLTMQGGQASAVFWRRSAVMKRCEGAFDLLRTLPGTVSASL